MQQLSLTSSLARLSKLQKDPLIILIPFFWAYSRGIIEGIKDKPACWLNSPCGGPGASAVWTTCKYLRHSCSFGLCSSIHYRRSADLPPPLACACLTGRERASARGPRWRSPCRYGWLHHLYQDCPWTQDTQLWRYLHRNIYELKNKCSEVPLDLMTWHPEFNVRESVRGKVSQWGCNASKSS